LYTVPAADTNDARPIVAWIDKFTVINAQAGVRTISVYLVPPGGPADFSTVVLSALTLPASMQRPDTCPEIVGRLLSSGWSIKAVADQASKVSCAINIREVE
jgi:hypothetical protein